MVDVAGHLGMALLFAAPAWLVWGRRGAVGFTGFTLAASMLPDSDLYLSAVLPIAHHGLTHTVLFVGAFSVAGGAVAARLLTERFNHSRWVRSSAITAETVFVFATAGLALGGLSHLFADVLSAPDIAAPLAPLWPVYREHIVVDAIYYDAPLWNFGLVAAAAGVHLVLARYESYPLDTRYRIGGPRGTGLTAPDRSEERD